MCGICGFYSPNRALSTGRLDEAARLLVHRGPDGLRVWRHPDGVAGFGHTRLAIIDLVSGEQPMCSADGRFTIVFNGEIYNFADLRSELESHGHIFRTRSDTEVLLNAYRQWGEHCLVRLNGMFAFAIFDAEDRKLFLARDRVGIKPLYYHNGPNVFVFGSELKSVLAWPEVPRRVDSHALVDFMMLGYPIRPATCFRDCRELEPGCFLEIRGTALRISPYWTWKRDTQAPNGSNPLAKAERELRLAVREHLVSDVPVGAFLSGGIDSSLLVVLQAIDSDKKIHTFNVKFDEAEYDESIYARAVAAHVGTEHHEISLETSRGDLGTVGQILDQFDQPFADSSSIPTYLVCREIRKHVKVVIGGDGGDEMFGGYPRFAHADIIRAFARLPRWSRHAFEKCLEATVIFPKEIRRRARRLFRIAEDTGDQRLMALSSIVRPQAVREIFKPEFLSNINGYMPALRARNSHQDPGGEELIDATVTYTLPGDYLRKVDVMSSAHGLEVRVPMLSNRILEFAEKLPNKWKYSLRTNKILLRRLARKYLPAEIATKRKQGFGIPLDSWLGAQGCRELATTLARRSAPIRDLLRPEYIEVLTSKFAAQEWDRSELSRFSLYQRIYALWSLDRWLNLWRPAL
jgi:asparagine synthase (glutamine-hydrolysing)